MEKQTNKERVREWLKRRRSNPAPLPEMKQIRRELGWMPIERTSADQRQEG
ncbi:MAG: hypothetical protein P4L91_13775 [Burkholderiaceae bacterium]|nr:hypothetical protein [Burkholderiaceae bacterium]